ncbi:MAG: DUF167 domain-containing protein [Candidatus Competibacteraceae bacterium]|nr:DUF167 domain-containing protein [Candidatus Competibacteraceae bacterium]
MIIFVEVKPGASRNEFVITGSHTLKIRITAPPIDGKANDALIHYLADIFDISKSSVRMLKGATSKFKKFEVDDDCFSWENFANR